MCGNETVRYIHIVTHAAGHELRVGCICAGKLSDDYEGARARERDLVNRSARREKWLSRRWRVSAKGNSYLKAKGHRVVIFAVGKRWGASVDGHASPNTWPSQDAAKLKAFDHLWPAPSKRTG